MIAARIQLRPASDCCDLVAQQRGALVAASSHGAGACDEPCGVPFLVRHKRSIDDALRLLQDQLQMRLVPETLPVDLVDVFGTGGACREPATGRHHLDAADRRVVTRRMIEHAFDFFAGQLGASYLTR